MINHKHKKLYIFLGAFFGLFLIFIAWMALKQNEREKELLANGIRTSAQVVAKPSTVTRKGKTKKLFLDLALWEEHKRPENDKKVVLKEVKNGSDIVDNLFAKHDSKKLALGSIMTVRALVGVDRYRENNIGDWVTYVYLDGHPEAGMVIDTPE